MIVGGTCSTQVMHKKFMRSFRTKTRKEETNWGNLVADGTIQLKLTVQNWDWWWALVNTAMNFRVS